MPAQADYKPSVASRVAGSSAMLVMNYGTTTLLSALVTIGLTRLLAPTGYGIYGTAVAAWTVLGATADLGTVTLLSRDLGDDPSTYRPMLNAAYAVAGSWSLVLMAILVALGLAAGVNTDRGQAILVLAPSMLFNGLNPAMSVFYASYKTKRLLQINVSTTAIQGILTVGVAAAGLGVVAVAAGVSVMTAVNSLWIALSARRLLPADTCAVAVPRISMLRRSVPLALLGVLTRVYGMLDLVLLGWYVAGPRLGDYAASSKLVTVFVGFAGQVMSGALPGLAAAIREHRNVEALSARVCHWLTVVVLPLFVGLALFPSVVVVVLLGSKYRSADVLVRILAVFGALAVGTNLAGTVLVAAQRMRPLYIQSVLAIIVNLAANLVLIPTYGVYASAWTTVGTEALVCACSFLSAKHLLSFTAMLKAAWRPILALSVASVAAVEVQRATEIGAIVAFLLVLGAGLGVSGGWPEEFRLRWVRQT